MKTKKELQDEELGNVSGGAIKTIEVDENGLCPQCLSNNVTKETDGEGCDKTTTYKCQDCGHTW